MTSFRYSTNERWALRFVALLAVGLAAGAGSATETPLAARYRVLADQCLEQYLRDGSNPSMARYAGSRNLSTRCDCVAELTTRGEAERKSPLPTSSDPQEIWTEYKRLCELLDRRGQNLRDPPESQ
jgi:hypothetical protein